MGRSVLFGWNRPRIWKQSRDRIPRLVSHETCIRRRVRRNAPSSDLFARRKARHILAPARRPIHGSDTPRTELFANMENRYRATEFLSTRRYGSGKWGSKGSPPGRNCPEYGGPSIARQNPPSRFSYADEFVEMLRVLISSPAEKRDTLAFARRPNTAEWRPRKAYRSKEPLTQMWDLTGWTMVTGTPCAQRAGGAGMSFGQRRRCPKPGVCWRSYGGGQWAVLQATTGSWSSLLHCEYGERTR